MIEPMRSQICAELSDAARLVFAPTYTAPEQLKGGTLTPGADVYALGALLHALLVGVHPLSEPFEEESAPCKPSKAALQISQDIAARRGTTPQQLARELRGGLDRIIAKATRHRPRGRYGNVEAFARRLRPYGGGAPIKERHSIIGWLLGRLLPCAQKDFADGQ
jgi:serine/threonine-protein kinase